MLWRESYDISTTGKVTIKYEIPCEKCGPVEDEEEERPESTRKASPVEMHWAQGSLLDLWRRRVEIA